MEEYELFQCQKCGEICVYEPLLSVDHKCPDCGAMMFPIQNMCTNVSVEDLKEGD